MVKIKCNSSGKTVDESKTVQIRQIHSKSFVKRKNCMKVRTNCLKMRKKNCKIVGNINVRYTDWLIDIWIPLVIVVVVGGGSKSIINGEKSRVSAVQV